MIKNIQPVVVTCVAASLCACGTATAPSDTRTAPTHPTVMDHHSFARPDDAVARHLDLDLRIDMTARRITGSATYTIEAKSDTITFDTDGLLIDSVSTGDGKPAAFNMGEVGMLGKALHVHIPKGTTKVRIDYRTGDDAGALLWVDPAQTADKKFPLLFTQGQAILTRSWIPIQDSPGIRITYNATVHVPVELMAVMSATNPQAHNADGTYHFTQKNQIPPYLMALAVGDLAFRPIGDRTGVYAERSVVDTAAWEFADMENMLKAAEELYGPYRWGRYDVLVLPSSFPFGGMENPCLTFATPTILAGDRSLTALIAHELAHSWSGNLVTNATWDDFWLNEGFTVYFEKRICERVYGADYAEMLAALGYQDLHETVDSMVKGSHPDDSHLKLNLAGRNPDDGMTEVAYEKGYSFLRLIESKVGREKFDPFLRSWFDGHAFQSQTTEDFIGYLNEKLLDPNKVTIDINAWVYGPGLPADLLVPTSSRFAHVEEEVARWEKGTPAKDLATADWSAFEWMHFLRHLPGSISKERMVELDASFHFTASGNSEVLAAWLERCIENDYAPAYEKLDRFLVSVGRRKFLLPLYEALLKTEKGRAMAMNIYRAARPNYHAVAVRSVDDMLHWKEGAVMF